MICHVLNIHWQPLDAKTHFYEEEGEITKTDMLQIVSLFGKCFLSLQQNDLLNFHFTEKLKKFRLHLLKVCFNSIPTLREPWASVDFYKCSVSMVSLQDEFVSPLSSLIFILLLLCFTSDGTKLAFFSGRLIFFVACFLILQRIPCKNFDLQLHCLTKSHSNNFVLPFQVWDISDFVLEHSFVELLR